MVLYAGAHRVPDADVHRVPDADVRRVPDADVHRVPDADVRAHVHAGPVEAAGARGVDRG